MDELESQVAKIQIGNFKKTNSYVHMLAEKAGGSDAELYVVCELPLFNPAAEEACETIALAISSGLKRAYRRSNTGNTFESAIAQINEELGKLAGLGQTHWIDKMHCIVAVKDGNVLHIATCGKVSAYLFRAGEFTDISCSSSQTHPLKTFENIASGKLKLSDVVILSTTQLLNYISIDRLKGILQNGNFLEAAQVIIEILKDNAGPEVAFGSILNSQVEPGKTGEDPIDLEAYASEKSQENVWQKSLNYITSILPSSKSSRIPKISLPKISLRGGMQDLGTQTKNLISKSGQALTIASRGVDFGKKNINMEKFNSFSKQKKFFFISVVILLAAIAANIFIASHYKKKQTGQKQVSTNLQQVEDLLNKTDNALLYNNQSDARGFLDQAQKLLPAPDNIPTAQQASFNAALAKISEFKKRIDKIIPGTVTHIGSLAAGTKLLILPPYLASQVGSTIVSYNTTNGSVQDGQILSSEHIISSAFTKQNKAVIYNGSALLVWDYIKKSFSTPFTTSVPAKDDFGGMAFYPVNSRVYVVNKKTGQIISFMVSDKGLSKPVLSANNPNDLRNAQDIAIDGNIYALNTNGVTKYQNGKLSDFQLPFLTTAFSGYGKIYTNKDFKNIYILDASNKRIIIADKKGVLIATIPSDQFTHLTDFSVDEKNKTIFVLNDSSLLKVAY